ncbi:PD-(D/E)XK nuclease family protein [Geosporobacter ferrireducens]|uniref:PD-(D/E)XK endonuclease-like domain-containing protein n=1 Tax=Geosporobacter ferrireducens TaxID=1424294 RepID=A0A1D8GLW1_9FIRM|nr:PD-(D/E)XK nuclease family protein [Geosporobacter ferrireducens]AOT71907.1 hypothetical protein Gferi_21635 [Geosporobacter ferrireducens]
MNPHVIPDMPIKPLKRISPSKYFAVDPCILREAWAANHINELLPVIPTVRVGIIAHRILELTIKGRIRNHQDIDEIWKDGIKKFELEMHENWMEKHLVPLARNAWNYEVKKQKCILLAQNFFTNTEKASGKGQKYEAEIWLETPDGKVGGKIDAIKQLGNDIQLIDYKTGKVFDKNQEGKVIKFEYQKQLKLYAAMYYMNRGKWPTCLTIVELSQKEHDIPFHRDECMELLNDAVIRLEAIKQKISGINYIDEIAYPSPQNCKYCYYWPGCAMYWEHKQDSDKWPADCHGIVKEKRILGNGTLLLVLGRQEGDVVVSGLSMDRHGILKDDIREIYLYNLERTPVPGYFKQGILTTCYKSCK